MLKLLHRIAIALWVLAVICLGFLLYAQYHPQPQHNLPVVRQWTA